MAMWDEDECWYTAKIDELHQERIQFLILFAPENHLAWFLSATYNKTEMDYAAEGS